VTAESSCPRSRTFPSVNSAAYELKVARDSSRSRCPNTPSEKARSARKPPPRPLGGGCVRGAASAARARRHGTRRARHVDDDEPAVPAAACDTPARKLAGSRPPSPSARTSPGTPNTFDSWGQLVRRTHGGLNPGLRPPPAPGLDHLRAADRRRTMSAPARRLDHESAEWWISLRATLTRTTDGGGPTW
jgi:hypothetical protein